MRFSPSWTASSSSTSAGMIADGEPEAIMASREVREIYLGIEVDA